MRYAVLMLFIYIMLLFFNGCKTEGLDFEKLSKDVNIAPEFVAPIGWADISVWDLVQSAGRENREVIQKDSTGLIKIVYRENDLIKYKVSKFIPLPAQQKFSTGAKVLGEILPDDMRVSTTISLKRLAGELDGNLDELFPLDGLNLPFPPISVSNQDARFKLESIPDFTTITLGKGTLEITLENELKIPLTIEGSLIDVQSKKSIADFTFIDLDPHESKTSVSNLAGVQLSNHVEFKLKTFHTPGSVSPVNIRLEDYFKISFKLKGLTVAKGHLIITKSQSFGDFNGVYDFVFPEPDLKAFGAVIHKGSISIKVSNTSKMTGSVNFRLLEIKKNGIPLEVIIPIDGNSTTVDLSGVVINLSADPNFPFNRIPYVYSFILDPTPGFIDFSSTDEVKVDVTLDDIEFKSITGDFGKQSVSIDPGNFNLNFDLLDQFEGDIKLANPSLELVIQNSIGMPATVKIDFIAESKEGLVVSLNPPVFDIPVPADIHAGAATKRVVFDKENSQIVDFIALPPTGRILYNGQLDFNTSGEVTLQNPNFVDMNASFNIGLMMELPLELQINQLGFKDTTRISGSDYNNFESADLIVNATNGIPLDFDMQLFFIDTISKTHYEVLKVAKILSAAQVNDSGEITPTQSSRTFSLQKTDMENLRKSNGLVFSGSISSPAFGTTVAPLYSDSELKLNVVIKSKINL